MAYMCIHGLNKECDGCGWCEEEKPEPCPECGSVEYYVRYKKDGEIIGCSDCISEV